MWHTGCGILPLFCLLFAPGAAAQNLNIVVPGCDEGLHNWRQRKILGRCGIRLGHRRVGVLAVGERVLVEVVTKFSSAKTMTGPYENKETGT